MITATSNEFYIEKRRMPVTLTLVGGEELEGVVFVPASPHGRTLLEDAPGYMNGGEAFFPLMTEKGLTRLVARAHVLAARANHAHAGDPGRSYGNPVAVSVQMVDGSQFSGNLMLERVSAHPRVLDYLNRLNDNFLSVYDDSGVTLLNRALIASVQSFDDGAA